MVVAEVLVVAPPAAELMATSIRAITDIRGMDVIVVAILVVAVIVAVVARDVLLRGVVVVAAIKLLA